MNKPQKPLFLTIKKEFFDMIKAGEKKEEYRSIKQYYYDRFKSSPQTVIFQNGYSPNSPRIEVEIKNIYEGKAKPKWAAGYSGECYVIKLGKILCK